MTHDQSSYQCMFTILREGSFNTLMSSVGTMTVLGKTVMYTDIEINIVINRFAICYYQCG